MPIINKREDLKKEKRKYIRTKLKKCNEQNKKNKINIPCLQKLKTICENDNLLQSLAAVLPLYYHDRKSLKHLAAGLMRSHVYLSDVAEQRVNG